MLIRHRFRRYILCLVVLGIASCGWDRGVFRPPNDEAGCKLVKLCIDSAHVKDMIDREAKRQKAMGSIPADTAELEARKLFLYQLKSVRTIDVPVGTKGTLLEWTDCRCQVHSQSSAPFVKVRLDEGPEAGTEGWVCESSFGLLSPMP